MITAEEILRRRVAALLFKTGRTRKDFAVYVGKHPSWSTEFLQGKHSVTMKNLDRVARFFGVSVPQLFELDGYRFRERRRGGDRRSGMERRQGLKVDTRRPEPDPAPPIEPSNGSHR